ncbi:MAG: amino acid ABC transporter permease [Spirochaetaceae bacterium]|jgi:polar amino acid transport system permease protein|nr:amino acid ABC transporter permease [Spirochaetaceae bacterium]
MADLFNVELVFTQIPKVLQALPLTLWLTVLSLVCGLAIGLGVAVVRIARIPVLLELSKVYVSVTRGTPVIVQLYLTYFGIPLILKYINYYNGTSFNINAVPPIVFALAALSLNQGAYSSETIRAAILSVDKGQIEAANSLGMTTVQRLRRIVIPQAFVIALPSLGNALISLLKETSLAFVCSVVEITARGKILAGNSYRFFESYCSVAIIYWVLTFMVEQAVRYAEKRLRIPDTAPAVEKTAPSVPKRKGVWRKAAGASGALND